jgi:outer membrane protein
MEDEGRRGKTREMPVWPCAWLRPREYLPRIMPRIFPYSSVFPRIPLYFLVFLGLPWFSLFALGQMLPDRTLTLDDSVRLALNNSQTLLSSREDVNIALQRVREAESLFYPRLDLNANWSKFRVEGDTPLLLQPALGPTLIPESPRPNFYTARANIYQMVYEGGRSRNLWRQTRIALERAKSANDALQTQVAANAKLAFYNLLLAQEKRRLFEESLRRAEPSLSSRGAAGLAEQLRLENQLTLFRVRAAEAARVEKEAARTYLRTLNLELGTTVALKGVLQTRPVELDLQKLLAWSGQYRSELRQTEYQQEMDALAIRLSQAERQPTVGFGATYERTGNDVGLPTANWAGTLNLNLPISVSDLVYGWAKVRERRAQYRQAALRHSEATDQIQLQVREAYDQYRYWQSELAPREQAFKRLEGLVGILRNERIRISERLEAEQIVLEAQVRHLEAIQGHLSALAALERAVGKPLDEDR